MHYLTLTAVMCLTLATVAEARTVTVMVHRIGAWGTELIAADTERGPWNGADCSALVFAGDNAQQPDSALLNKKYPYGMLTIKIRRRIDYGSLIPVSAVTRTGPGYDTSLLAFDAAYSQALNALCNGQ